MWTPSSSRTVTRTTPGASPTCCVTCPPTYWARRLTLGLARNRIEEAGLIDRARFIEVQDGERRQVGPFDVEFIPVTHSVPHGFAIAFHTPQGVILHSGDFKIDLTPVDGRRTDLARIGALADNPGIRLLLSDSTNAEESGFTESEKSVGATLQRVFAARPGRRIVVACFASHIHRIQQILEAAAATGRKVATLGRSMRKNVELAERLGLLSLPDRSRHRHRRRGQPPRRRGLRSLHRISGRAAVCARTPRHR